MTVAEEKGEVTLKKRLDVIKRVTKPYSGYIPPFVSLISGIVGLVSGIFGIPLVDFIGKYLFYPWNWSLIIILILTYPIYLIWQLAGLAVERRHEFIESTEKTFEIFEHTVEIEDNGDSTTFVYCKLRSDVDLVAHQDHRIGCDVASSPAFELGENFFLKPGRCKFVPLVDDPHRKEYRIVFEPRLSRDESLEYWIEYVWPGMFCITREQCQKKLGEPFEYASYTVRQDTDILKIAVKFNGKLGDRIKRVDVCVYNLAGEEKGGEVDALKRRRPEVLKVGRGSDGKMLLKLTITRPKIAYVYGIKWELP